MERVKKKKKESQKNARIKRLNSQQTLVKTNKQSIKRKKRKKERDSTKSGNTKSKLIKATEKKKIINTLVQFMKQRDFN